MPASSSPGEDGAPDTERHPGEASLPRRFASLSAWNILANVTVPLVGLVDAATDNGWFITAASVGAFGTVWLVKYAVCDQYLFGSASEGDGISERASELAGDGTQSAGVR